MGGENSKNSNADKFVNSLSNIEQNEAIYEGGFWISPIKYKIINKKWWWTPDVGDYGNGDLRARWMPVWYDRVRGSGAWEGLKPAPVNLLIIQKLNSPEAPIPYRFASERNRQQPNHERFFISLEEAVELDSIQAVQYQLHELANEVKKVAFDITLDPSQNNLNRMKQAFLSLRNTDQPSAIQSDPSSSISLRNKTISPVANLFSSAHANLIAVVKASQKIKDLSAESISKVLADTTSIAAYIRAQEVVVTSDSIEKIKTELCVHETERTFQFDDASVIVKDGNLSLSLRYYCSDDMFKKRFEEGQQEAVKSFVKHALLEMQRTTGVSFALLNPDVKGVIIEKGSISLGVEFAIAVAAVHCISALLHLLGRRIPPEFRPLLDRAKHSLEFGLFGSELIVLILIVGGVELSVFPFGLILAGLMTVAAFILSSSSTEEHPHEE